MTAIVATLKVLASAQVASANTDTTIYTVGAGKAAKVQSASLHNSTNIGVTVTVSVVPNGGSVDGTHRVLSKFVINGYDTITHEDVLSCLRGIFLDTGAFVSINCDTGAALNVLLTGVELS